MTFEFSWRYLVLGFYVDREKDWVRIYPLPFVRVSIKKYQEEEK